MSRSLWTISELAFRQIYGEGGETKNTLEEFVETAKDEYASQVFNMWLTLKNDEDLSLLEGLLHQSPYPVQNLPNIIGEDSLYIQLDVEIFSLPRDLGVFAVHAGKEKLTKGTFATKNLFASDPGEKIYYRLGDKLFFPDGFSAPNQKEVMVTFISLDLIDDDLRVPDFLATPIRDKLFNLYGKGLELPEDPTDNKNPTT
jgi:hypothetical protein